MLLVLNIQRLLFIKTLRPRQLSITSYSLLLISASFTIRIRRRFTLRSPLRDRLHTPLTWAKLVLSTRRIWELLLLLLPFRFASLERLGTLQAR